MTVADAINLKPDVKYGLKEYAPMLSQALLSKTIEERDTLIKYNSHSTLYDVIDTNGDGHVSVEEFKVYLKVVAPDVTEDEAKHAFDVIDAVIDADKNGEISREEFFKAATDFFFGVEELRRQRLLTSSWGSWSIN